MNYLFIYLDIDQLHYLTLELTTKKEAIFPPISNNKQRPFSRQFQVSYDTLFLNKKQDAINS